MNIRGLCVCVNYADLLAKSLKLWKDGLDDLTIVTAPKDTETQELCRQHDVRCYVTDTFYANEAKFNKGAAMSEAALNVGLREDGADWLLTFDADIVPPPDWRAIVCRHDLKPGLLYGTYRYQQPERAASPTVDRTRLMPQGWVIGFFSLFHETDPALPARHQPLWDIHWPHAGNYDTLFTRRWPTKKQVLFDDLPTVHLGEERQNWCGRYNKEALKDVFRRRRVAEDWNRERMPSPPTLKLNADATARLARHLTATPLTPLLSILVCSLESRAEKLATLLKLLERQKRPDVEILTHVDNGELTVGGKRQKLLLQAKGEYVCFIDDDDTVSDRYVEGICAALGNRPDCVSIPSYVGTAGRRDVLISRRPKSGHRNTNHITPVRRDMAVLCGGFSDVQQGEDADYSFRVNKLLSLESPTDPALVRYHYHLDPKTSATIHFDDSVLYRNRFGGEFTFEVDLHAHATLMITFRVGDAVLSHGVQAGKQRCRFVRTGDNVRLTVNGTVVGTVPNLNPTTSVAIFRTAELLRLLGVTECVINGRPAKIPYKRTI